MTYSEPGGMQHISIHALRGEGDVLNFKWELLDRQISIHALRGEGDAVSGHGPRI